MASGMSVAGALDDLPDLARKLFHELPERGGGALGVSAGTRSDDDGMPAGWVFQNAAPLLKKFRIVVCMDEAQNTPVSVSTKGVMDCLHRAPRGFPWWRRSSV